MSSGGPQQQQQQQPSTNDSVRGAAVIQFGSIAVVVIVAIVDARIRRMDVAIGYDNGLVVGFTVAFYDLAACKLLLLLLLSRLSR